MEQTDIVQYDYHFIMSIRNQISMRLPEHIFKKVTSYKRPNPRKNVFGRKANLNKFIMSRNPESLDTKELESEVKKEMTSLLNKVSKNNLDKMKNKVDHIVELLNKVTNRDSKNKVHKILMIILLHKAVTEGKNYSNIYAILLQTIIEQTDIDYREYIDNLFVDMKKCNQQNNFSKDYDTFCNQLKDKSKFINLFVFIGELFKLDLIEMVLIKKYLMILLNKIVHAENIQSLELETNAHCIKNLLSVCDDNNLYGIVYPKFKVMQNDTNYKFRFRFILMDINETYEKQKHIL